MILTTHSEFEQQANTEGFLSSLHTKWDILWFPTISAPHPLVPSGIDTALNLALTVTDLRQTQPLKLNWHGEQKGQSVTNDSITLCRYCPAKV